MTTENAAKKFMLSRTKIKARGWTDEEIELLPTDLAEDMEWNERKYKAWPLDTVREYEKTTLSDHRAAVAEAALVKALAHMHETFADPADVTMLDEVMKLPAYQRDYYIRDRRRALSMIEDALTR